MTFYSLLGVSSLWDVSSLCDVPSLWDVSSLCDVMGRSFFVGRYGAFLLCGTFLLYVTLWTINSSLWDVMGRSFGPFNSLGTVNEVQ